ncbi:hydroxyphenylacetyl-CoA thioesterase PaaI [soil metagenome]
MADSDSANPLEITRYLLSKDPFSLWMGIEVLEADLGYCKVGCTITHEMCNGFGVTHGGILFSLADTALAFSAATYGRVALAIDNSISFMQKTTAGNKITASSRVLHQSHKIAVFNINISKESEEVIAYMKGTVYRTSKEIEI